ncbi:MAG: protein kinase, partial [Acidobacteria bacterium]|nr:protein kinase [Acidobacteriota bacterium]
DPANAAKLFSELGEWAQAGAAWERAGNAVEAAGAWERAGDFNRADEVLTRADLFLKRAQLLSRLGRVEEAVRTLLERGDSAAAWEILSHHGGTFPGLADELAGLATWLAAHVDVPTAISAVQRAVGGLAVQRNLLSAFYTQAKLLEQQGDWKSAEGVWQRIVDFDYAYQDAAARLQDATTHRLDEERTVATNPPGTPASDAANRYSLEKELGRGGMGVVYRATDNRLGRTVAIKILNPRQHNPEAIRRLEREARAAAALSHPGIVHIYDFDEGFGSHFIAMEFVSGPTLTQLLRDDQAYLRRHFLAITRQIVDAVAYAHAHSIVHRDLKPANMILADRRQVKILDFGIARRLDELESTSTGATGTPFYMAPEQILGEDPDQRTDVYALGVTLFQLSTGTLPFPSGNILRSHLEVAPPDPRSLVPDIDPAIAAVILRCLAKPRDQRPADGAALLTELEAIGGRT